MIATGIRTMTYKSGIKDYMVDIVTHQGGYEAWIYRDSKSVKHFMFGAPKSQQSHFEFLELVQNNLENYIEDCERRNNHE